MAHLFGSLELPAGMIWVDEFDWRPVESSIEYSVTGALIVDAIERQAGRPVTLQGGDDHGWLRRDQLMGLYDLAADPDAVFTLLHDDGRQFDVMFRPGVEPIVARQIALHERPEDNWPYIVTVRLIEV